MYCTNCGSKLNKKDNYCSNCAHKVEKEIIKEEKIKPIYSNGIIIPLLIIVFLSSILIIYLTNYIV